MLRKNLPHFILILSLTLLAAACDDSASSEKVGSPCDESTSCDGVCNTALPDGMCIKACDEVNVCDSGTTCIPFTETQSYCVPSCTANTDCREGYTCAADVCQPLVPLGGPCDAVDDCELCENQADCPEGKTVACNENICSIPCSSMEQCPDTTYCGMSGEEYWCVLVDFEQGENTFGASCGTGTCADGFTCLVQGADDIYSYCTKECTVDRDCPPTMYCGDDGSGSTSCLKRGNCDACDLDGHCGFQTDKCVTSDPAVADENYCSVTCDPDRAGTCPLDYTCMQAYFCADRNAWVADCSWCPTGTCEAGTTESYQCFRDFGACMGNGNLCEPCSENSDCSVTDGACLSLEGMDNYVCTTPCDDTPDGCPDDYMCVDGGSAGDQCIPRTGSCTEPSGGKGTCRTCSEWSDCTNGGCLPPDGNFDNATYCLDYCDTNDDCGAYASCENLTLVGYNVTLKVCLPNTAVDTCTHWRYCNDDCPDPTQTCSYSYCVPTTDL